jgi:hypothetical protein
MKNITTVDEFGASFSVPYCEHLGLVWQDVLLGALETIGLRQYRLMSYWNRHEAIKGKYDFAELDQQVDMIEKHGGTISLCLGVRQPRWPEMHPPEWAKGQPVERWQQPLLDYIRVVMMRYKDRKCITSWQLENEAFNHFGDHGEYSRSRIIKEMKLVKSIDPVRPVIMTTSDSWGIPLRGPRADVYACTYYKTLHFKGKYHTEPRPALAYKLRAGLIRLTGRKLFIHELQAEPWGPGSLHDMTIDDHECSISLAKLKANVAFARKTGLAPYYFWGLEWWYFCSKKYNDNSYIDYIRHIIR